MITTTQGPGRFMWVVSLACITWAVWLPARGQPAALQLVRGSRLEATLGRQPLGRLASTTRLSLAIGLPLRNAQALSNLLSELYNPASPNYRHFLTPEQFIERFGPTERDYERLTRFAKASGWKVTATHPNRMLLDVEASVLEIGAACHLKLHRYRHPTENREFFAPDTDPSLDLEVPVLHISGLDNYSLPHPRLHATELGVVSTAAAQPNGGSGPGSTFMGRDFRAAYIPDSPLLGTGQVVGLLQFDGYSASDITYYETLGGLPNVPLVNVLIDGASGHPSGSGGEVEVSLDIEMAISMAPGLSKVMVYMAPNPSPFEDILNRMATDNLAKQLSCSWYMPGGGANPVTDQIFQQMAAQGQSFFNASGDYDAYTGLIDFPGDTPYITQVGGTTLTLTTNGGAYISEKVWNWGNGIGSGGGVSTSYSIPSWQTNLSMTANQGSTTMRNTPDVALTADNVYVRADGRDYNVGGTSCAAPLWAGFMALVNQQAVAAGRPTIGFANPPLYAIGQGSLYNSAFHDITVGNNESGRSPTRFSAVVGYDLCTGWGAPAGSRLITALATPDPLIISPVTGFAAVGPVGGPFNPSSQICTLTNLGPGSLSWALTNSASWLTVSPTAGALDPGGPATPVTISLSAIASNLTAGNYSATVWFTNLNDGVGQAVQFTLAALIPPAITNQPADLAVLGGATASFTVGVSGSLPLSYQWQHTATNLTDGNNLTGSTTSTLVISNVGLADLGPYSVLVTNAVGMTNSAVAQLTMTPSGPVIIQQPADQTVYLGRTAVFSVGLQGTPPFTYQWTCDSTNLPGATSMPLVITNAQFSQAGTYAVVISNSLGWAFSSNALLTVNPPPPCALPPSGLVSWWRGEGNAFDQTGSNNGALLGSTTYGSGEVGQAFVFSNANSEVSIGNPASLQLQNFSIEAWIKRFSTTVAGFNGNSGVLLCYGSGGYGFGILHSGQLFLTKVGADNVTIAAGVSDTNFHHLAVTKSGTNVVFYIDGAAYPAPPYSTTYQFSTPVAIGARADNVSSSFYGVLDEISVYNRALTAVEVQSIYLASNLGKCLAGAAPVIAVQPTNQTVAVGSTVMLAATVTGTQPFSYQWTMDSTNLAGATTNPLVLTNVQLTQAGTYALVVSNAYGAAFSSNALLTVNPMPPGITSQPTSQSAILGSNVIFSVTATGTPPLSFQWEFNGAPLLQATNISLLLTNVQLTNAGSYSVLVTNIAGSVQSSIALLTVVTPPTNCAFPPAALISWWRGEGNPFDQLGNNNGTLVGSVSYTTEEAGQGFVFNGSGEGVAVGNSASLQLQDFTIEAWIKRFSTSVAGFNGNSGVLFCYGLGGYGFGILHDGQLYLTKVGVDNITIAAGVSDTNFHHLAVTKLGTNVTFYIDGDAYPAGPYVTSYYFSTPAAIGARGDDFSANFYGEVDELSVYGRPLASAEIQTIYAAGMLGKCVIGFPPMITAQPTNEAIAIGSTAVLGITTTGTPPLDYQWTFDSTNIPSATNRTLVLTNAQLAQAGIYAVVVSNAYGVVLSSNAVLTVNPVPPAVTAQPLGQATFVGSNVTFYVSATGTPPLAYQWQFNGAPLSQATNTALTIFDVQLTNSGSYSVLVTNIGGAIESSNALLTVIMPPTNCAPPASGLVSWWRGEGNAFDQTGSNNGTLVGSTTFGSAEVGQGFVFSTANSDVSIGNPASLQLQNFSIEAWVKRFSTTVAGFNGNSGVLLCYGSGGYGFGILHSGQLFLTKVGADNVIIAAGVSDTNFHHLAVTKFGTNVVFYIDGTAYPAPPYSTTYQFSTPVAIGARADNVSSSFYGVLDEISVYNRALTAVEVQSIYLASNLGKCLAGAAPVIAVQPTNQTVAIGSTVMLAATVTGTQPFSYQWTMDSTNLAGATTNPLVLTNVQLAQAGTYALVVSNTFGVVASSNAVLTVKPLAPTITSQPMSQAAIAGSNVIFTVRASGTPPLSYQWQFDGASLSQATDSSLLLPNVQLTNAGTYSVLVTNVAGSVQSSNAVLTVINPPATCNPAPAGLVSWWRAEANALDSVGTNNGTLRGNTTYGPGKVGQAFLLDGNGDGVSVGNPASLQLQDFSIETWIKRSSATAVTASGSAGVFLCYGLGGYGFGINNDGTLFLTRVGIDNTTLDTGVTDTSFHHVAVTKEGTNVVFYIDGGPHAVPPYSSTFQFSSSAAIGARGDNLASSFYGEIDELSIYRRALTAAEILSIYAAGGTGKCPPPPRITAQPQSLTVVQGGMAAFIVGASSTWPLNYQWTFNDTNLPGATSSTLVISNTQPARAGSYAALVFNAGGATVSSNATLTVLVPPAIQLQPSRQLALPGCTVLFSVQATGSTPLSYQWWKNSQVLPGQTSSNLTLVNIQTNDLGNYSVVITNVCGSVTSSNASLAWDTLPLVLPVTIQRFAVGGVRVRAEELLANDSDADGDLLSVTQVGSSSAAGGSVSLSAGWVYYLPPSGFTNADSFACTVSDGHCGGYSLGVVSVGVRTENTPSSRLFLEVQSDDSLLVSLDGLPGASCRLQSAPSLSASWQDVVTGTVDGYGVFRYFYQPPTNLPTIFYRGICGQQ